MMGVLYRSQRQPSAPLPATITITNASFPIKRKTRQPMRIRPKAFLVGLSLGLLTVVFWIGRNTTVPLHHHNKGDQQSRQSHVGRPLAIPASPTVLNDERSPPLGGRDSDEPESSPAMAQQQQPTPSHGQPLQQGHGERCLTFYFEPITTTNTDNSIKPLPRRRTSASSLQNKTFPRVTHRACFSTSTPMHFPVDDFPREDPYLPWIHDYFVRIVNDGGDENKNDCLQVQFVAQNKRRCETGEGKEIVMKYWEPQMALFQPVPVERFLPKVNGSSTRNQNSSSDRNKGYQYRLASPNQATAKETRFLCRFHVDKNNQQHQYQEDEITLSTFNIPYEYVNWRKHKGKPMFRRSGSDVHQFEFSQLLFSCPVPERFRSALLASKDDGSDNNGIKVWLDLIPIRTPPRHEQWLLTPDHIGPDAWKELPYFNTTREFGTNHVLPAWQDSGRIANLPLCPIAPTAAAQKLAASAAGSTCSTSTRQHRLVVCTWTAFSYRRRGDSTVIQDAANRLREWIVFHKLAGVDHIYIYDNTQVTDNPDEEVSPLLSVAAVFPGYVTYISWPYQVCSNNRPNHKNPGERSSQYAAEASCRERFGPQTEWMSFIDTDEYLVPMRPNSTWTDILEDYAKQHPDTHVLKFRSSRGRPREQLLQVMEDQSACKSQSRRKPRHPLDPCLTQRSNETFLRTYNCDYIKPPKPGSWWCLFYGGCVPGVILSHLPLVSLFATPLATLDRFARAMKQIYRPSFVLSHFVHYSTITTAIVRYYREYVWANETDRYTRQVRDGEWGDAFFDELHRGALIHTKTVLPYETMTRTAACEIGSKHVCAVGHVCPESTLFNDTIHTKNLFVDEHDQYCNCWVNPHVEKHWVPRLEEAVRALG